jgi:hypothetical protein
MQCSELELVFEQEGIPPLAPEAREHLATCNACKQYVEEVTAIVAVAHQFPAEADPPERIWVSLRNQLESEGIIRDTPQAIRGASWWSSFADLFRTRVLATASVAVLLIVAAGISLRPPSTQILEAQDDFGTTVRALNQQEHDLADMRLASTGGGVSDVDTSLRQNLQQVDDFISDCEHRAHEVPSDALTRDYLANAYQQKAQLLSAMMDRGRSLN